MYIWRDGDCITISGINRSLNIQTKLRIPVVARAGLDIGRMTNRKVANDPAPSIFAESITSFGRPRKYAANRNVVNGTPKAANERIKPWYSFSQPRLRSTLKIGYMTTWIG